jgi:hypothetical protein
MRAGCGRYIRFAGWRRNVIWLAMQCDFYSETNGRNPQIDPDDADRCRGSARVALTKARTPMPLCTLHGLRCRTGWGRSALHARRCRCTAGKQVVPPLRLAHAHAVFRPFMKSHTAFCIGQCCLLNWRGGVAPDATGHTHKTHLLFPFSSSNPKKN